MGITERKEREKEYRRNMILDAAEKLFFTKGINTATMDDVAEEAELSKGTLYLYFKNKDDLYHGIHLRGLKILKEMFENAVAAKDRGIDKVRAIGEAYYHFSQEYKDYFDAMMFYQGTEVDVHDPTANAYQCFQCGEEVMGIVARALQSGIEDGTIRADLDPVKTAYVLRGQTFGIIHTIARDGGHLKNMHGFNAEELILELFDLIRYALSPHDVI